MDLSSIVNNKNTAFHNAEESTASERHVDQTNSDLRKNDESKADSINCNIKDIENNVATEKTNNADSTYECTICLETAKDSVVSFCGHLFCWPCLHQWLETRPQQQICPVCKAAISKDKVIPLYGRESRNQVDPRLKAPPRPSAQRTEPESNNFRGYSFPDGGFHMTFGIGAFPFGFFTSTVNMGNDNHPANQEEQFISKIFLWIGIFFLAWLMLA